MAETETAQAASQTVRMVRHEDAPSPHSADVHPDEVANWQAAGWSVAADTPASGNAGLNQAEEPAAE